MAQSEFHIIQVKSIEDRVRLAFAATTEGIADPVCTEMVDAITQVCGRGDERCEIDAIYYTVMELAIYRNDPGALDLYKTLRWLIRTKTGDCSSFTIALLTLLALRSYSVGVSTIWQGPDDWDHIYTLIGIGGYGDRVLRLSLDATKVGGRPGFEQAATKWRERADWLYDPVVWMAWHQAGADMTNMPRVLPVGIAIVRHL